MYTFIRYLLSQSEKWLCYPLSLQELSDGSNLWTSLYWNPLGHGLVRFFSCTVYLLSTDLGTKIHAASTKLLLIITFLCPTYNHSFLPSIWWPGCRVYSWVQQHDIRACSWWRTLCKQSQFDYCVCIKHVQQQWWLFSQLVHNREKIKIKKLFANVSNKCFSYYQGKKVSSWWWLT